MGARHSIRPDYSMNPDAWRSYLLARLWQRLRPEGYFGLVRWFGRFR